MLFNAVRDTLGGKNPFALVEEDASTCSLAEDSGVEVPIPTCAFRAVDDKRKKTDKMTAK
jgi:hypothetical protein